MTAPQEQDPRKAVAEKLLRVILPGSLVTESDRVKAIEFIDALTAYTARTLEPPRGLFSPRALWRGLRRR